MVGNPWGVGRLSIRAATAPDRQFQRRPRDSERDCQSRKQWWWEVPELGISDENCGSPSQGGL